MNAMILACAIAILGAQTPISPERDVPQRADRQRSDATISANLNASYLLSERLNPFNITVTTTDGVVTLGGAVKNEHHKQLAEDLALGTQGVNGVVNNIRVMPVAYSEKDRRNFRQKVRDRQVTAAVRSRLVYHRTSRGFKVGIRTINNVVTLHGIVDTEDQYERIEEVTYQTRGVEAVNNQLLIVSPEDATIGQHVRRQFSEGWYASRVRSAIAANRHISIRDMNVEVQDGVCYLTGRVNTEEERELAEELALGVQGIYQVENHITLYDEVIRIGEDGPRGPAEPAPQTRDAPPAGEPLPSVEATELPEP